MDYSIWAWAGFGLFIFTMLALDLGVLNRKAHVVKYREAAVWSVVWVALAAVFAGWVFWSHGSLSGKEFVAGYLIELSLSVDNLFVFLLLFSYFKVPAKFQHRVLFWGVLGALFMRITMIGLGAALIERFHWIIYVFGVLSTRASRCYGRRRRTFTRKTTPSSASSRATYRSRAATTARSSSR